MSTTLWYTVIGLITGAYAVALLGGWYARRGRGQRHARFMTASAVVVGVWLIAYVTKQVLYGRDVFPGNARAYGTVYLPVLTIHVAFAVITILAWSYNFYLGLRYSKVVGCERVLLRLRKRHRRWGVVGLGAFGGTLVTAYAVYAMLFLWDWSDRALAEQDSPAEGGRITVSVEREMTAHYTSFEGAESPRATGTNGGKE